MVLKTVTDDVENFIKHSKKRVALLYNGFVKATITITTNKSNSTTSLDEKWIHRSHIPMKIPALAIIKKTQPKKTSNNPATACKV
jgi:hypothetical protein